MKNESDDKNMNYWNSLKYYPNTYCKPVNDIIYLMASKVGYHITYAVIDLSAYEKEDIARATIGILPFEKWNALSSEDKLKLCAYSVFTNTKYKDDYFYKAGRDMNFEEVKMNLDLYAEAILLKKTPQLLCEPPKSLRYSNKERT